ncbi:dioxygenase [Caenimonas koreensis DSM 17982]|uniref:Dioxygenase n=1 Tax=Caenimonas koreensis DSM 17982 TaxID=1121255 RepID=A0A844B0J4_9BURK|nr:class III extradiol ring-cleavage dioxygenase [Caenimonas koreensis]MRD46643.1 dioxygenase [Caenimonas koreensis DSM 17982]
MQVFPSVFVSHGAPTFAIEPGIAGPKLAALGRALGKPRAVVVVSPHWMTAGVSVTSVQQPETVHDFGGFPAALYDIEYPAKGAPELASLIVDRFKRAGWNASLDATRGLDHGAWVPLLHMFPHADIPVLQVSMPRSLDSQSALRLGQALAWLGEEGVLVIGSGSLTHNLYEFRQGTTREEPYAREFAQWIRTAVQGGDAARLVGALRDAPHAARAHPTAEHFLPLLVAAGAAPQALPVTVLEGGIEHGVLSMDSFVFGRAVILEAERQPA